MSALRTPESLRLRRQGCHGGNLDASGSDTTILNTATANSGKTIVHRVMIRRHHQHGVGARRHKEAVFLLGPGYRS